MSDNYKKECLKNLYNSLNGEINKEHQHHTAKTQAISAFNTLKIWMQEDLQELGLDTNPTVYDI